MECFINDQMCAYFHDILDVYVSAFTGCSAETTGVPLIKAGASAAKYGLNT